MGGKNSYESIKRYQDKVYDKVLVRLPKGKKDTLQACAAAAGESVNAYINAAIDARTTQEALEKHTGIGTVSLPSGSIMDAQAAAKATGESVTIFIARAIDRQAERDRIARESEGGEQDGH